MFTTSAPRITVRFVALLTAVSLVLSAFPAAFFVANAQEVPPEVPATETPADEVTDLVQDTEEPPAEEAADEQPQEPVEEVAKVAASIVIDEPSEDSATIIVTKIICDDESDLPNWGGNTENPDITADTAEDWVESHEGCYFAKGWQFQWAPLSSEISNPGDTLVGEAGAPWTTFSYSTAIPESAFEQGVWVREVLQDDYIPFTFYPEEDNTNDVSAEIYCDADVLNYDNFDYVGGLEDDATYYCVAWNVPVEVQEEPECEIGDNLINNGSFENPKIDNDFGWEVFPSGTPGLSWIISWLTGDELAPDPVLLEIQDSLVAHSAFSGTQYAELDSNWNGAPGGPYSGEDARVKIEQTVTTTPGATYRLAYAFSALPGTDSANNVLKIGIDGIEVATQIKDGSANSDTDWSVFSNEFVANSTSTIVSFADAGISDSFGTLLDGVTLCKVKEPEPVKTCSLTIKSDASNMVVERGANAVETWVHPNWIQSLPLAKWIWADATTQQPRTGEQYTFENKFGWNPDATVTDVTLKIAADNLYNASLNSSVVADEITPNNIDQFSALDTYVLPTNSILDGNNVFSSIVKNVPWNTDYAKTNPGGLYYELVITGEGAENCAVPYDDEPETYTIDGYKFNDQNGDGEWDEGEPAIGGWEINLWDGDFKIATTSTNGNGYYSFTVEAGNYQVTETQQEGWEQTATLGEADGNICYFNFDDELLFSKVLNDEYQNPFEGQCVFGNHQNEVVEEEPEEPEEPTRKGSSGTRTKRAPQGQVLGATTQCGLWLEDYMQKATVNDTYQVLKLQAFLTLQGFTTPLTGIFDATTEANVKLFQAKYADTVIKPWFEKGIVPHNRPTGFVYKTTRWQINDIMCPGIEPYPSFEGENLTTNVLVR